jgi:DNA polymerase III subunit beta
MIVECERERLLGAITAVSGVIAGRGVAPVYHNLKVRATSEAVSFMATDLEVTIRHELPVSDGIVVDEPGDTLWPASRLTQILRECRDESVRIHSTPKDLEIVTATSEYHLPAEDVATFTETVTVIDEEESDKVLTATAGDLSRAIHLGHFASSREPGKYALNGMLWTMSKRGWVDLVSTDGKRLAISEIECVGPEIDPDKRVQSNVPLKGIRLLGKFLAEIPSDERVKARLRYQDATFQFAQTVISSRCLEGTFPPYRTVIPKTFTSRLNLTVAPFFAAVRQAAIMTDDESKRVEISLAPGLMTLAAQGTTTGKSKVKISLPDYNGAGIKIAFDPQYLTEFLRSLDGETELALDLINGEKSAVFRMGERYLYLVVPLV